MSEKKERLKKLVLMNPHSFVSQLVSAEDFPTTVTLKDENGIPHPVRVGMLHISLSNKGKLVSLTDE